MGEHLSPAPAGALTSIPSAVRYCQASAQTGNILKLWFWYLNYSWLSYFCQGKSAALYWLLKQNKIDLSSPSVTKENKLSGTFHCRCNQVSTDFIWMKRHRQQETVPAPVHIIRASLVVWEDAGHFSYICRQWGNNVHVAQIAGVKILWFQAELQLFRNDATSQRHRRESRHFNNAELTAMDHN